MFLLLYAWVCVYRSTCVEGWGEAYIVFFCRFYMGSEDQTWAGTFNILNHLIDPALGFTDKSFEC